MTTKNALNISVVRQTTPTKKEFAGSPDGIVPYILWAGPSTDFTLSAASGAQNVLPAAIDTFTLEANTTYLMEGQYILNTGATTHTTAMGFGGTATYQTGGFEYVAFLWSAAANTITTTQSTTHVTGVASKVLNATSTAVYTIIKFSGVIRTSAAGTLIPQINFSANPTGTNLTKVGSYVKLTPIGAHNVQTTSTVIA